ncbi:MAG: glutamate--tRNA ligase [Chloroflexi bacterium]|nr:glutamate--tRNA ligase [Chloroflexota bacterium]
MTVRVRFAPSPTGLPHVGGARTALFNWLLARSTGGQFILRIEDTDQARLVPEAVGAIEESLRWLGLDWDEGPDIGGPYGPYTQSERLEHYQTYARQLVEDGAAYECFCSSERLTELRTEQQKNKQPPRYDNNCRDLEKRAEQQALGGDPVVRFKIPDGGTTSFTDAVRGEVSFENSTIDDFVILKSDGFPTAHLAHVTDDHLMEISHVMRGEEWVSSTPRQILLYQALGWEPPMFVHMSVILGPDKAKLSKRHGALSVLQYRDDGYLPEAMFNFLGLIGWSLDDHTVIISRDEFVEHFALERMGKNPAVFDMEKLTWMNGVYLRDLPEERLAGLIAERLESDLPESASRPVDNETVRALVPLVRERIKRLDEVAEMVEGFFTHELNYSAADLLGKRLKKTPDLANAALTKANERCGEIGSWHADEIEQAMRTLAEDLEMKPGDLFMLLRVACTGRTVSPPLFESMEILGRERCLSRIETAAGRLPP